MNTAARLGAFGGVVVAAAGVAALVGAAVGPIDTGAKAPDHGDAHSGAGAGTVDLQIALDPASVPDVDTASTLRFDVADVDDLQALQAVVVSHDFAIYHHLESELGDNGDLTVGVPALAAGTYHVYLDVEVAGSAQTEMFTVVVGEGDDAHEH